MEDTTFLYLLIFLLLAAGLIVYGLNRKRWRLWRVVQSGDPEQVEVARGWITPRLVPYLEKTYWREKDWDKKLVIVELLQDQTEPGVTRLMLDYLRAPLGPGDERAELAQAVALGFIDERYDRFMDYYNNRTLLAQDRHAVLKAHGLRAEPSPRLPSPPARPTVTIPASASPNQRLLLGISANDLRVIEEALLDRADINVVIQSGNHKGCSALILAMLLGRFEIARFLIEQGADIHFTRSDLQGAFYPQRGQTALSWAAYYGHLPLAEELIRRGADVNVPDHHGGTPLIAAAKNGQLEMVRFLVEQGADVDAQISDGRKAFHLAVTNGQLSVVEYLLEMGSDPNEPGGSGFAPLMVAVAENFYDLACLLIEHGADVNGVHSGTGNYIGLRGRTPLVFAVGAGLVRMTKMLIEAGADVNYRVPAGQNWDGSPLPERSVLDFATGRRAESIKELLGKLV